MKKLLLLFALVISVAASGVAQNANRSGVFVEAGTGFLVGSVPYSKTERNNLTVKAFKAGGPDLNLSLGYRGATSSVFAWQLKAEVSTASTKPTLVFALMPGIRYTTKEIAGNTSLYFGFDLGLAIGSGNVSDYRGNSINMTSDYAKIELNKNFGKSIGAKFSLSGGLNITTALYAGLYWDYNVLSKQIFNIKSYVENGGTSNWGSLGIRLGYRF